MTSVRISLDVTLCCLATSASSHILNEFVYLTIDIDLIYLQQRGVVTWRRGLLKALCCGSVDTEMVEARRCINSGSRICESAWGTGT